jgi:hypothetical protein
MTLRRLDLHFFKVTGTNHLQIFFTMSSVSENNSVCRCVGWTVMSWDIWVRKAIGYGLDNWGQFNSASLCNSSGRKKRKLIV